MRERRRPGPVAYHEAGHVVACWHFAVPIRYATIQPEGHTLGTVKVRGAKETDREKRSSNNAVIAFAGPAAQRRAHPRSRVDEFAHGDRGYVEVTAESLFAAIYDRESFARRTDREARALVEKHWLAVDRVARALQAEGALSGHAMGPLMEEAEEDWRAASAARPGLSPFAYARERAIMAQGPPALRRQHVQAVALRLALAGQSFTEATVIADLTARGFEETAVRRLWSTLREHRPE